MKPGGVVSLKKVNIVTFFGKNKLLILMISVFITGFFISSVFFSGSKAEVISKAIYNSFIADRKGASFLSILFATLLKYVIVAVVCFMAGASVGGVVLSPIICCSVGLYFGTLTSYFCSAFALKGVAFNSVILIPPAIIFSLCILFLAKEAFIFSSVLLRMTFPNSRAMNISAEFKIYCGKFLLIIIFVFIASIVDAAISGSFIKYFSFI